MAAAACVVRSSASSWGGGGGGGDLELPGFERSVEGSGLRRTFVGQRG